MSETIKVRSDVVNEDSRNVLGRILLIIRPYWGLLTLSVALNLLASVFDNLITFLHQKITDQAVHWNRSTLVNVAAGQKVAMKHPAVPGENGTTVIGSTVKAAAVKDIAFPAINLFVQ